MYISEAVIGVMLILAGLFAGSIVSFLIMPKLMDILEVLAYARRVARRRKDLRKLIARAEAKGVDIPERVRSAAT